MSAFKSKSGDPTRALVCYIKQNTHEPDEVPPLDPPQRIGLNSALFCNVRAARVMKALSVPHPPSHAAMRQLPAPNPGRWFSASPST